MGLREPDSGQVRVLGMDPKTEANAIRQRIGIQLQEANLPDALKVWEALDMFSAFYNKTIPWEPLLEQWGLADKRNTGFKGLSGGQKQRLFIALALINDPEVVFLDELTTGLDPQARRATWDMVRAIRDHGKTVVLVTHFMDEAEALADRIAIINGGKVVALDTPKALIDSLKTGSAVTFSNVNGFDPSLLESVEGVSTVVQQNGHVVVSGTGPLLAHVATALAKHNITPSDLSVSQPDLEDVFLALTGKTIRA